MDFRGPERSFEEADRRYAELKRLHEAGEITEEEFDEQLKRSMVQDEGGRWWSKSRKSGEWHYNDGNAWVPGTPPDRQQSISGHKRGRPDVQHDYAPEPTVRSTEVRAKVWLGLAIACAVITVPCFMILMVTFLNLLARPPLEGGPLVGGGIILIVFLQLLVGSLGVFFSLLTIRAVRPMGGKLTYTINGMGLLEALAVVLVVLAHVLAGYMNTSSEQASSEQASSEQASPTTDTVVPDLRGKTISEAAQMVGTDYVLELDGVMGKDVTDPDNEPKGTIVSQRPYPSRGERETPSGAVLKIYLSGGQDDVVVPEVTGLTVLQAHKKLLDAGVQPNMSENRSTINGVRFDQNGNLVEVLDEKNSGAERDVSQRTITEATLAGSSLPAAGSKTEPGDIVFLSYS
jgi:hypothetical protein